VKLYYSPTSPYVRKVMACAITRGLDDRIERVATNPHVSPPDLLADNPLSKVPGAMVDIGTLSIACALGYLDFRFAAEPWRTDRPRLAAWFDAFSAEPGIARTVPKDPV